MKKFVFILISLFIVSNSSTAFADHTKVRSTDKNIALYIYSIISGRSLVDNKKVIYKISNPKIIEKFKQKTNFPWEYSYLYKLDIKKKRNNILNCIYTINSATGGRLKVFLKVFYKVNKRYIKINIISLDSIIEQQPQSLTAKINEVRNETKKIVKDSITTTKRFYKKIYKEFAYKQRKKPITINFQIAGVYNSNVPLVSKDSGLPSGMKTKVDWGVMSSLDIDYKFFKRNKHTLSLNLGYNGIRYNELDDFNYDCINGGLSWDYFYRKFKFFSSLKLSRSWFGSDSYNNVLNFNLGTIHFWNRTTWTEFNYNYTLSNYLESVSSLNNRDGDSHNFSLGQKFRLYSFLIKDYSTYFGTTFNYGINNSSGANYDSYSYGATFSALQELPRSFYLSVSFSPQKNRFKHNYNNNSNPKRKDTRYSFYTSLTKEINKRLSVFVNYRYLKNKSNIDDHDYTAHITVFGIQLEY